MIYIFTALYCEAHALIRQFCLKKNQKNTRFQEFYGEGSRIRLAITGTGEIAAAAAASSICTAYPPAEDDLLLNIGICAHTQKEDGIFLCNQIFEQATGRSFYPDMLISHDFQEAPIVTGRRLWNAGGEEGAAHAMGRALYDMEAAAVYQAGAYFFGPHQMMFLKLVSDYGRADGVSGEQVKRLMEQYKAPLSGFIGRLQEITGSSGQENMRPGSEEGLFERLCQDLHCSKAMGDSLGQHLHYLALTGTDYVSAIESMYQEGLLPCKDKREGKLRFEQLKRRLF